MSFIPRKIIMGLFFLALLPTMAQSSYLAHSPKAQKEQARLYELYKAKKKLRDDLVYIIKKMHYMFNHFSKKYTNIGSKDIEYAVDFLHNYETAFNKLLLKINELEKKQEERMYPILHMTTEEYELNKEIIDYDTWIGENKNKIERALLLIQQKSSDIAAIKEQVSVAKDKEEHELVEEQKNISSNNNSSQSYSSNQVQVQAIHVNEMSELTNVNDTNTPYLVRADSVTNLKEETNKLCEQIIIFINAHKVFLINASDRQELHDQCKEYFKQLEQLEEKRSFVCYATNYQKTKQALKKFEALIDVPPATIEFNISGTPLPTQEPENQGSAIAGVLKSYTSSIFNRVAGIFRISAFNTHDDESKENSE